MRTDAKIGFAIVGVLLAVLAVYAVVIPKKGHQAAGPSSTIVKVPADPAPTPEPIVSVPPVVVEGDPTHGTEPTVTRVPADVTARNGEHPPVAPVEPPGGVTRGGAAEGLAGLTPGPSVIDSTRPLTLLPEPPANRTPPRSHRRGDDAAQPHTAVATASHPYRVRPGQTLSSIAAEVYGNSQSWKQIAKANPTVNPAKLKVGTKLMLPDVSVVHPHPSVVVPAGTDATIADEPATLASAGGPSVYRVQSGDSLYKIAKRKLGSGRRADELYELNRDAIGSNPTRLRLGMVLRLPTVSDAVLLSDASR